MLDPDTESGHDVVLAILCDRCQPASFGWRVVGNVFGRAGFERIYEVENRNFSIYGDKVIWRLGYVNAGDDSSAGNDPKVNATLLRHGNWDGVTQSVVWDPNVTDTNLPPSLYLTGKPSWWGNLPWPAIGSDLNPMTGQIPAQVRFLSILESTPRPSPPQNLRVVDDTVN